MRTNIFLDSMHELIVTLSDTFRITQIYFLLRQEYTGQLSRILETTLDCLFEMSLFPQMYSLRKDSCRTIELV